MCSIALARRVGDDGQGLLVGVVEGDRGAAVDREHADELAACHRRHGQPALGVWQPGHRDLAARSDTPAVLERAAHRSRVLGHLLERADAHGLAARCGSADDAVTDRHLGTDARGIEARAADGVEGAAGLVEQHQVVVGEAEQLVEAVERGVDEHVEVGAPPDARRQLGQFAEAGGAGGVATSSAPGGAPTGAPGRRRCRRHGRCRRPGAGRRPASPRARRWPRRRCAAARRRGHDVPSVRRRGRVGTRTSACRRSTSTATSTRASAPSCSR